MTLTVACVLRSGGIYDAEWVDILRAAVERNLRTEHRFVCLTDQVEDVRNAGAEPIELEEGWPGWWSKIELFRPDLFDGHVLYFDLDTVIVRALDDLPVMTGFCTVREPGQAGGICSTAMTWSGDHSFIYRTFWKDADYLMHRHDKERPDGRVGDQAFILDALLKYRHCPTLWQTRTVASYKYHCRKVLPNQTVAVAFHGTPKPPEALHIPWVAENWRA